MKSVAPVGPAVICFVIAKGIMSNGRLVWVSPICFALCVALSGWPVTAVSRGGLLDSGTGLSWFTPTPSAVMGADQHFLCGVWVTTVSSPVSHSKTCLLWRKLCLLMWMWWRCSWQIDVGDEWGPSRTKPEHSRACHSCIKWSSVWTLQPCVFVEHIFPKLYQYLRT